MVTATRPAIDIDLISGQSYLLADYQARTLAAIAGCLSGETLLDLPGGDKKAIASMIGWNEILSLSDDGIIPALAYIFCKGQAQLYELTTESGKIIETTVNHCLLVFDGQTLHWHSVGEIMPMLVGQMAVSVASVPVHALTVRPSIYSLSLQESNLESCQLIHAVDDCYYPQLPLDYQDYCSVDFCPYDGQSHREINSVLKPSPLQGDVLGHSHLMWHEDVPGFSQEYTHACQYCDLLSKNNSSPSVDLAQSLPTPVLSFGGGLSRHLSLISHQVDKSIDYQKIIPLTCQSLPLSNSFDVPYIHLQSLFYHDKIINIKPTRIADYYDMFVPEYHNYLAESMVHHNTGGGKTAMGYWWLYTRMEAWPGFGWGVVEPTYQMLEKILINSPDPERPSLIDWLKQIGIFKDYKAGPRIILTTEGVIYLGSADNPDTMQGPALKGYWLDEGGMMSLVAHQTALQRISFYDGQEIISTTPYNRGWLKTEVSDKNDGNYIHVEKWRSIDNPRFPAHVYEEMRQNMQPHRFRMMYEAEFERPIGMIYSSFDSDRCVIPPFTIPRSWPRYIGVDYGPIHTAVIWYARCERKYDKWPAGTMFAYREYLEGNKSIDQHVADLKRLSNKEPIQRKVASPLPSERQWRREFSEKGWHLQECRVNDVELGIDRVWAMHQQNKLVYFNTLRHTISQKEDYRRKLDENQQPTDVIENKEQYHFCDAERYIIADLAGRRPVFEA